MITRPTLLLLGLVVWTNRVLAVDDWPQFRGADGQGHATARGVPTTWSESENVRWKTPIRGSGWSSPVVAGDQVWLTTAIEEEQSLRAICVARESGQIVHDVEVFRKDDLGRIAAKNSHASPTPVLDGDSVFVHFGAHGTACLTREGEIVWARELPYDHRHGPGGSPIVWKDLLIVSCDGPEAQYTTALDKRTGEVRWKVDRAGKQAYCTPIVIKVKSIDQLLISTGEALIAYSPADGNELWRFRHAGHSVVPRPVFGNELVYFCTGYWTPSLLAVRADGRGDVTQSHLEFSLRRGVPHNPSPLLVADRLLMASDQGVVTCADARTGQEVWRQRVGGNFSASPTLADGKLFLLDENATMYVIAPGNTYQLVATNHLDGRTLASPAFCTRSIFLRTDTHLYRLEEPRNVQAKAAVSRRDVGTFIR
ncbi:MAG TPA: PQQ-binding-like beta-propeller repeat protein [Pirellulales bacterium]|nr:PQQ-binding-like beta-propeller repeat protein [Pirellulales bacterium]